MIPKATNVYEQLVVLALMVEPGDGRLIYRRCPHCRGDVVRTWRPRDHSHEGYANCPACHWGAWERTHEADMQERYGVQPALLAALYERLAQIERAVRA